MARLPPVVGVRARPCGARSTSRRARRARARRMPAPTTLGGIGQQRVGASAPSASARCAAARGPATRPSSSPQPSDKASEVRTQELHQRCGRGCGRALVEAGHELGRRDRHRAPRLFGPSSLPACDDARARALRRAERERLARWGDAPRAYPASPRRARPRPRGSHCRAADPATGARFRPSSLAHPRGRRGVEAGLPAAQPERDERAELRRGLRGPRGSGQSPPPPRGLGAPVVAVQPYAGHKAPTLVESVARALRRASTWPPPGTVHDAGQTAQHGEVRAKRRAATRAVSVGAARRSGSARGPTRRASRHARSHRAACR